ncbi:MAG TPA: hypothetical protein ENK11_05290, partial [Phycisphaerales bacterium]|nr:hypothetical protein [Phycisphaerales bacterium]
MNKDRKHRRTGLRAAALVLIAAAPAWARLGTATQDEPDRPADTKQTEQPGEAPADSPAVLPAASADDETDPLI